MLRRSKKEIFCVILLITPFCHAPHEVGVVADLVLIQARRYKERGEECVCHVVDDKRRSHLQSATSCVLFVQISLALRENYDM